ncbi:HD-GYP domain-containing protein, partial [Poseidonibacter sp.]
YSQINELTTFIIISRKQLLQEQKVLESLIVQKNDTNKKIFKNLDVLNTISNEIKLDILNHSDKVSKQTTIIILAVGIFFLILIFLSASTLISRINVPLSFILEYIHGVTMNKEYLSSRLPITTNDEFGKLSKSFNKMTKTISKNIKEIEHLNEEIVNTQKEVIFTMGAIGESRSKETGNHVKRVAEYSKLLAIKYGLDERTSELLKEASPMHDIGKVGIPDAILKKPGQLFGQEWKIMKTHAQLGYEMLKHSKREILKTAAIVAYEHHEKWDGSGYPRGLKGEDIHIYGRITAVADVFDALGSDRCYKKAWPLVEIKQFFIENKGIHFDPDLVDVFFENLDEFLLIRKKYEDTFD